MTNGSIRIAVAVLLFAVTLLSLACGPTAPPPNANVQNQKGNVAQIEPVAPALAPSAECDEADLAKKRDKVAAEINKLLVADSLSGEVKVLVQLAPQNNPTHLEIGVEGLPAVKKSGMKKLVTILEKFLKSKCGMRVVFVKRGTFPLTESTTYIPLEGFEWLACDPPTIPCMGECREPAQCPMPSPPVNANANRPANTNSSNTASNSNGSN